MLKTDSRLDRLIVENRPRVIHNVWLTHKGQRIEEKNEEIEEIEEIIGSSLGTEIEVPHISAHERPAILARPIRLIRDCSKAR